MTDSRMHTHLRITKDKAQTMKHTDSEIAPCPFCGSEAALNITSLDERSGYNSVYRITCTVCGVMISRSSKENANGWMDDPKLLGKAEAIAAWNTRQPPSMRNAVIEECAAALEADAKLCDCSAHSESECACGAWDDYKTITSQRAVEIIRALAKPC